MSSASYSPTQPAIDFGRACKWMFSSPNWLANFFWVFICGLLGVFLIGHILFIGYQLEIFQNRIRGQSEGQADFNFDKLGAYFVRGLIPFALNFVFGLLFVIVSMVSIGGWTLAFTAVFGEPEGAAAAIYIIPVLMVALVLGCLAFLTIIPLCMRGGVTNNFAEGFNFPWALETAKFMWSTMLVCLLYVFLLSLLGQVAGILTCFVGFLVVIPWLQLAMTDIGIQAYDVYEAKGGQPLPMEPL